MTNSRKVAIAIVCSVILAASVLAHIRIAASDSYAGVLSILDRFFDLGLTTALSILFIGLGSYLAALVKLNFANNAERISFSLFLGTGTFGIAVLGLGLVGLLRPLPVFLLAAFAIALSRNQLLNLLKLTPDLIRAATGSKESRLLFGLAVVFIGLLFIRTATPPYVYDEAIYHLPVTSEFVRHGRVFPELNNCMGNQPFLIHMVYAVCLLAGSDIAAKMFSLVLAITTAIGLYAFCRRFLTQRVAVIAAFGFFAAGMVTEIAVTTRVDVSVAGMLFMCTYAMINYLDTNKIGWLWVSAALGGFSLGVKHSAALWILLIAVMYLFESFRRQKSVIEILSRGIIYTAIALAIASPWYVKNQIWFDNPFYPFFTGEFAAYDPQLRYFDNNDEKKLDDYFAQARVEIPDVVKSESDALVRNVRARPERHPMLPWEQFIRSNVYLMSEDRHFPNFLFLLVPASFFVIRQRWLVWLLVLSCCYFFMATSTTWIARYLLPIYPPLTIIIAQTLETGRQRLSQSIPVAKHLPIYALIIAMTSVLIGCFQSIKSTNSLGFVVGKLSRSQFMNAFTYYEPIKFINRELPKNARLLSIGAQMMYGVQRDYVADETWYTTKWRRLLIKNNSLEELNQDLKNQGIEFVIYSPDLYLFGAWMGLENGQVVPQRPTRLGAAIIGQKTQSYDSGQRFEEARMLGPDYPLLRNWATFSLYRNRFLDTVYSDENGFRIYKIK